MTAEQEETSIVEMFHGAEDKPFTRWTSFTIRDAFDDPLGSFDFETCPGENEFERYYETLQKGDMVIIKVNGHVQQIGLIQTKQTTFSRDGGSTIRLRGNWPISILYDSGIDADWSIDMAIDTSAYFIISNIGDQFGLTALAEDQHDRCIDVMTGKPIYGGVKDTVNVEEIKLAQANPQQNEKAYAYIARLITRLGLVLRQRYDGFIIATKPHYEQASIYNAALPPAGVDVETDLFMDGLTISDSNDDQYSMIIVRGEASDKKGQKHTGTPNAAIVIPSDPTIVTLSPQDVATQAYAALKGALPAPQVEILDDQFGTFTGSQHQLYRAGNVQIVGDVPGCLAPFRFKPLYLKDKSARDAKQAKNVAMLAYGLRAPKAFNISGTVAGLVSASGRVWTIDTICNVQIPQIGLNEDMWLMERTFKLNRSGGQTTDLKLLPKGWFMVGEVGS